MKKTALLCIAAIMLIGIQSCSIEEQEEIAPKNFSTPQETLTKSFAPPSLTCEKRIYVYFGNMSTKRRLLFREKARRKWYSSITLEESLCPLTEIWLVPCDAIFNPKSDGEESKTINAEASEALGDEDGTQENTASRPPVYLPSNFINVRVCTINPEIIDPNPDNDNDDDGDTGDTIGIPIQ
ncbi:hypothetical protein [Aquimarina sp. AU474]|uniref:hypothetical protein n=1 Tax=Aquimarina sp. AU474 TaxID=2108529 RepID=UPI000D692E98|nr:hypothetical protein [Aquimarina sp. AU474]